MKPHKININNYPYGTITKTLEKAVNWLNKNMDNIQIKAKKQHEELDTMTQSEWEANNEVLYADYFDYPDYWGIPKSIRNNLNGDEVDFIQEETYEWWQE